jgi:hypothetical protein
MSRLTGRTMKADIEAINISSLTDFQPSKTPRVLFVYDLVGSTNR